MIFKDCKAGNTLFALNRNTVEVKKMLISNVTAPHIESKINNPCQLMVDITVNIDGASTTYVVPEGVCSTLYDCNIISCDKDYLLNEIRGIKGECEHNINTIDETKLKLEKCNIAIADLDDAFREKQQNDARLSKLEAMVQSLLDKLS